VILRSRSLAAALSAIALAMPALAAEKFVANPLGFKWDEKPAYLPKGAKVARLSGDPSQPGPFAVMIKLPASYKWPAHWHSQDQQFTIVAGRLYVGRGDKPDADATETAKAGSYFYMPAKTHYYAYTRTNVMFQVHGMGPLDFNYVDPADDPRKK
jgi:mannose-6-phosphate isomerase-like protein (cupin superfamily)